MAPLQHHPKVPKYWKLADELREQIQSGALLPGARLPSVAEMQELHGVSLGTVDKAHALLEKDGLIVREQGRGTFVAQPVSSSTAHTLGLLLHVDSLTNFYTMDLLAGMREEALRQNLNVLWLTDDDVRDSAKADAILLYCHPSEALALNIPPQTPQALLFQHTPDFTSVAADDFIGTELATRHLLDLGHRRIAYLVSSDSDSISRQRLGGYRAALRRAEVQADEKWVRLLRKAGDGSYRSAGEEVMNTWLREDWESLGCTAILAHNDATAIGVIKALSAHGLQVPEDVSVVGFDGTELSQLSTPTLTTIKVPLREIGATAVKQLAAQIGTNDIDETQSIVLPVHLQAGESTTAVKTTTAKIPAV